MIQLTEVPQILQEKHSVRVDYFRLYYRALAGDFHASRSCTGRMVVDEADLPQIAAIFINHGCRRQDIYTESRFDGSADPPDRRSSGGAGTDCWRGSITA